MSPELAPSLREALALLGVRRLLLGIHDAAWPGAPDEDLGRGSPCSDGAGALLALARDLGFDGVQLGPQGATSASNPSPYDGTLFSRNPLSLALAPLAREGLLLPQRLEELAAARPGPPDRVAYRHAFEATRRAIAELCAGVRRGRDAGDPRSVALAEEVGRFRDEHVAWLLPDALYEVLESLHGGRHFTAWEGPFAALERVLLAPPPGAEAAAADRLRDLLDDHGDALFDYALVQHLLAAQHRRFRERAHAHGLVVYADLQVGMSARDAWGAQAFTLAGFRMGAPPSRTNPEGQAWNYPLLDPRRYSGVDRDGARREGRARRFFRERIRKVFAEHDGMRIDHPHGLVCPWVYPTGGDPDRVVREGARLFDSPDLPELAPFAIARRDQLDPTVARHADGWVRALEPAQVDRYAALFDVVVEEARAQGREGELACEVLSTMPYPLGRVLARHGLGRFRVTQKADLANPADVYRSENARPEDWVQLGNHDTSPIWVVAERWVATGAARGHAEHLASRLLAPEEDREGWVARVAADPAELAQATLADLFVGPARNVMIYFTDLFGAREPYNRPGVVAAENWSLRVPPDPRAAYAARVSENGALDLPRALARALRSRGAAFASAHRGLLERLDDLARGAGLGAGDR